MGADRIRRGLAAAVLACLAGGAVADEVSDALAGVLGALRAEYGFPGATTAVALPDGRVAVAAVGLADVEAGRGMTPETPMLAASIGKTFVAAAALALAREGRIDLDAPVSAVLSDREWFGRLPNAERITLRHLLTHTSGLPDHVYTEAFREAFAQSAGARTPAPGAEALVAMILDEPAAFPPGEGWAYSDTGYLVAGMAVEAETGRTVFDVIADRFLGPLALSSTAPSDRPDLPGLAAGYVDTAHSAGLPPRTTDADGVMIWDPGVEGAGGGLVSTSRDLAVWGRALYSGAALEGDYLTELTDTVTLDEGPPRVGYGLGVAVYEGTPAGTILGHGGWIPGYVSSLRYYADHGVAVAFQINTDVGIADDSTDLVPVAERRLAEVAIAAAGR